MNHEDSSAGRPPAIEELDNLHIGPPPIRAVIDAGHTARRRRRTTLASIAAVTALLIGGGLVSTQVLGNDTTDKSLTANADDRTLRVTVTNLTYDGDKAVQQGTARWDQDSQTLAYVSRLGYSGSCPPEGEAKRDGAALTLGLSLDYVGDRACTADANVMLATITGLTEAPTELAVIEGDETLTIPVETKPAGERPFDALDMTLMLGDPNPDGSIPSRLRVENNTSDTVTEPGCSLGWSTHPSGITSQDNPTGPLRNPGPMVIVDCAGPTEIKPGYAKTQEGPTFRTSNLTLGAYLAVMDYGDLRTERITAPFEVPALPSNIDNSAAPDLTVTVGPIRPVADYDLPLLQGSPYWSPERRALLYYPSLDSFGSCPVDGTATKTDDTVTLTLRLSQRQESCSDNATRALITITGLAEAPVELTVANGDETRTLPVVTESADPFETTLDLPTNGWREGDGADAALIQGVLSVDDNGCVYLAAVDAPKVRTYVLWPDDYTAALDQEGTVTLIDAAGVPTAREGDNISTGGGYTTNPGGEPCLPASATQVASVQSDVVLSD